MIRHAIITGSTGTIGMALIQKLISQNSKITLILRPCSARNSFIPKSKLINSIECELSELNRVSISQQADTFYHLAWMGTIGSARNNKELQEKNIQYTKDAVDLAKKSGCTAFIYAGSQAEYGRFEGVLSSNTPTNPETEYGKAKLEAGNQAKTQCKHYGINYIWTRILSVYGAYDAETTMISSTITKILKGEIPDFTACEQQWDYLYSKDAATALYLLGIYGKNNEIYPIGSGIVHPLRYYVEMIRDIINPKALLNIGTIPYTQQQIMYLCADISNLCRDTNFVPEYTFEKGIKETIMYEQTKFIKQYS
jgi:nucleoside-diphosphate-sugar epimerase